MNAKDAKSAKEMQEKDFSLAFFPPSSLGALGVHFLELWLFLAKPSPKPNNPSKRQEIHG